MTEFVVPCLFGLEGLAADELRRLKLADVRAENGRVRFSGDCEAAARANLWLRTGERVLLSLGRFPAPTFDALFEGVRRLPLEDYIPRDGAFPVKGYCLNSALHSVPDCQRIIKKAAAVRLGAHYHCTQLPETGTVYQLQFSVIRDEAEIFLDTTGTPLFKRGYRPGHVAAPLRETLAAAMVSLARYRGRDAFCDPFCGSGTLAIEAALAARNRAPGLMRHFSMEFWAGADRAQWDALRDEARAAEYHGAYAIFASDLDPEAVALTRANAERAGVAKDLILRQADALRFDYPADAGVVVTNPPYGERLLDRRAAEELYAGFGRAAAPRPGWKVFLLSSHPELEQHFGRSADKKRKLYNGMLQCNLFMFFGDENSRKTPKKGA